MIGATLFSGIGAPEMAMPHWQWAWSAEIDKFPVAVLAARHPLSVNLRDVSANGFTTLANSIATPDVLVFGSPCQSYSVAGQRLGLDDPRGNLALVALGIVDRLKPRWFVFENVPGLLSSSEGRDFGLFLRAVDDIGYHVAWTVLDAQYAGLAQRRERVFAVGHLGDWRYPAAVLFEPEGVCGHSAPRRKEGKRIAPTIASRPTGGGGLGTDFDCDGGLIAGTLGLRSADHPSGLKSEADFLVASHDVSQPLLAKGNSSHRCDAESYVAMALNAKGGSGRIDAESETFVTHAFRGESFDAGEDGTGRGTPLVVAFSSKDHGADAGEIAPLDTDGHSIAIAFNENIRGELQTSDIAYSLKMNGGKPGQGYPATMTSSAVRRLTPRECERLQGFPDDYTLVTYRGKPAADGHRYKALGNSMAVPVMRWILSRIEYLSNNTE